MKITLVFKDDSTIELKDRLKEDRSADEMTVMIRATVKSIRSDGAWYADGDEIRYYAPETIEAIKFTKEGTCENSETPSK